MKIKRKKPPRSGGKRFLGEKKRDVLGEEKRRERENGREGGSCTSRRSSASCVRSRTREMTARRGGSGRGKLNKGTPRIANTKETLFRGSRKQRRISAVTERRGGWVKKERKKRKNFVGKRSAEKRGSLEIGENLNKKQRPVAVHEEGGKWKKTTLQEEQKRQLFKREKRKGEGKKQQKNQKKKKRATCSGKTNGVRGRKI